MAENGQRADGVSLTGIAFDKDLYGAADPDSYARSIGVADEDEQDEREQALRRCAALPRACSRAMRCAMSPLSLPPFPRSLTNVCSCHSRMQYTAPKSVTSAIPVDDGNEVRLPPLCSRDNLGLAMCDCQAPQSCSSPCAVLALPSACHSLCAGCVRAADAHHRQRG